MADDAPVYQKVKTLSKLSLIGNKLFHWYSSAIVRCSPLIFCITLIVSIVLCFVGFWVGGMPSFKEPLKGFETRGTDIMDKVLIGKFINENTHMLENSAALIDNSDVLFYGIKDMTTSRNILKRETEWDKAFFKILSGSPCISTLVPGYALGGLSHITIKFQSFDTLLSYETISQFCQLQKQINLQAIAFRERHVDSQVKEVYKDFSQIHGSITLPNLIACHFQYSDCDRITEDNVEEFRAFMLECESERQDIVTCNRTQKSKICIISKKCESVLLRDAFKFGVSQNGPLRSKNAVYSIYYLPVANAHMVNQFVPHPWNHFRATLIEEVRRQGFDIVGVEFGMYLHNLPFTLMRDLMWLMLSTLAVMLLIIVFTRSVLYSILVIVSIALSVGLSYFMYVVVFRISFFPLMNSATFILIIGLGADDAFILSYCWNHAKAQLRAEGSSSLDAIAENAFKHGIASMFVTSLTTAIAFYTNVISDIIVIKCFGLLAGTMVLTNFILVFLLLSSFKVIQERWERVLSKLFSKCPTKCFDSLDVFMSKLHKLIFGEILLTAINGLKYLIIFVGTGVMIGALIVLFYKPKLTVPSMRKAEIYVPDLQDEWHRMNIHGYFPHIFEKNKEWIRLIWGVSHVSGYSIVDPNKLGTVHFNDSFKVSVSFIRNVKKFTRNLGNTTLISDDWTKYQPWAANFLKWSREQSCLNNITLCCNLKHANYVQHFDLVPCLLRAKQTLENNVDGPIFRTTGDRFYVVAWTEKMQSSFMIDDLHSHGRISKFQRAINTHTEEVYSDSTYPGLNKPISISSTSQMTTHWDVENSLLDDTPICMVVSVAVAVLTIVISTLDLKLSLLSALSICSIIVVTIASLVLRGWYIGIAESTIIILAVGISFDFTLHYAVTYKLTDETLPVMERIRETYQQIGSAVFAAALTTFVGGATMIKSVVLLLNNFAVFMMIITVVSWLYSTFYFSSLLLVCDQLQTCLNNLKKK